VDVREQVVVALRRVEAAAESMTAAADALRTVARNLETGPGNREDAPDESLELAASSTQERLGVLTEQHARLRGQLESVMHEREALAREEAMAAEEADRAMRELGGAEAGLEDEEARERERAALKVADARARAERARAEAAVAMQASADLAGRTAMLEKEIHMTEARLDELRERSRQRAAERTTEVPVRELALQSLAEIGIPAPSNLLSRYIAARFGREVKTSRWGPLRADERAAYERADAKTRQSRLWLLPAIDGDGREQTRLWVRSDWDEEQRTVPDIASRELLQARAHYLAELAVAPPEDAADPQGLEVVAEDEAQRAGLRRHYEQPIDDFLAELAQQADYVQWPLPLLPDVPF
jgi:hypothetical protein